MKPNRRMPYSKKVLIANAYFDGKLTVQQIADKFGITRQYVYQLIKLMNEQVDKVSER